ncbi:MAG: HAD hydrolase family protein [Candidatus Cloacimonetes bacterium]|nr:HAD hydrolase family protein [Candidatus Cloacimonadota bacterium]
MTDFNKIKIIFTDCDGVMTNNSIIYDNTDYEIKNFSARDGLGVKLWHLAGGYIAIITGRKSHALQRRVNDLKIDYLKQQIVNKVKCAEEILNELNLDFSNAAFIGDDFNDLLLLKKVAFSATPIDCAQGISQHVDYVTTKPGGRGALRELIDYILQKQNKHDKVIQEFLTYLSNN